MVAFLFYGRQSAKLKSKLSKYFLTVHTSDEILPNILRNKMIELKVLICGWYKYAQLQEFRIFEYPMSGDEIMQC